MPPSSTVEGDGQRKSEVLEDKRDSPEGADTVASELQRLSLVKKAGEKMLQQLSMKNPIEPLTVDSIDSEQTLRCFLPNQLVRNQWNFQ